MTLDGIIGAAYTLIGAAAGAMIAFIPLTAMGVMTRLANDQRVAKLVSAELAHLERFVENILAQLSPSTIVFTPTPKAAWAYALTQPSFILSLDESTFAGISRIAESTGVLDDILGRIRLANSMASTSQFFAGQEQRLRDGLNSMAQQGATNLQAALSEHNPEPGILFAYRRDLETRLVWGRIAVGAAVGIGIIAIIAGGAMLRAVAALRH